MSRAEYLARAGLDRPRPGGRWHRILRALETGPLTVGDLFRATNPGVHDARLERRKIVTALRDLSALGLIQSARPWGWAATAEGALTRERLDAQQEPASCIR